MTLTDEELDRDWKPNGRRPQSTIARSFSQELMDIFRIENSIADLGSEVDKKKQQVDTQTSELESIERRIREMEERLRSQGGSNGTATASNPRQRQGLGNTFGEAPPAPAQKDLPQRPMGNSRPGTAKTAQQPLHHGGALPPTPTASEDGDGES